MNRPKRIHVELELSDNTGIWLGKKDRWSRNAKHHFSRSDLKNALEIFLENCFKQVDVPVELK